MKVSEAEKLVCPFISNQWANDRSYPKITNCITSKCMAWVKKIEHSDIKKVEGVDGQSIDDLRKKAGLSSDLKIVNRKKKLLSEIITFGIKIEEECGYCQRLKQ